MNIFLSLKKADPGPAFLFYISSFISSKIFKESGASSFMETIAVWDGFLGLYF